MADAGLGVTDAMRAEARAFNEALEKLLATVPAVNELPPQTTRDNRESGKGVFGAVVTLDHGRTIAIPGRSGDIPARVFVPESPAAVYLHVHGGGWVLGSAFQQDQPLANMAERAGVAVVSVDYRLAPEHPYPAGPDDCEDAALWLLKQSGAEFGTDRLLIGGESAGAHLAALTLLRMRDDHGAAQAFSAANLVFGAYDLTMTPSQALWGDRNLVLSAPIMQWFYDHFLPEKDLEARRAPAVSPLYADLTGMPPALFSVGELDPLLDDSLFMAARWEAAGNETRLEVWPDAVHGFTGFPLDLARTCVARQIEFVREHAS
jgi:acetyl esterase/lipase